MKSNIQSYNPTDLHNFTIKLNLILNKISTMSPYLFYEFNTLMRNALYYNMKECVNNEK